MPNRLVSFANLAAFLETDYAEADAEGKPLAAILEAMTAVFERYLKRTLSSGSYTEDFWGTGATVPLAALPVASVASVSYQGAALSSDDYDITPAGIRLKSLALDGSAKLTVSYTGGYTVTSGVIQVPDDIRHAAVYQIAHEWKHKDKPGATLIETAAGRMSVPEIGLLAHVKVLLHAHIHPAFMV